MFLNDYSTPKLLDQDVDYYGFLESKEFNNWLESIKGGGLGEETRTMETYDSPYFGMQSNSAYRELDRIYETYKTLELGIVYEPPLPKKTFTTSTISPALILAAAAAAFFIGG